MTFDAQSRRHWACQICLLGTCLAVAESWLDAGHFIWKARQDTDLCQPDVTRSVCAAQHGNTTEPGQPSREADLAAGPVQDHAGCCRHACGRGPAHSFPGGCTGARAASGTCYFWLSIMADWPPAKHALGRVKLLLGPLPGLSDSRAAGHQPQEGMGMRHQLAPAYHAAAWNAHTMPACCCSRMRQVTLRCRPHVACCNKHCMRRMVMAVRPMHSQWLHQLHMLDCNADVAGSMTRHWHACVYAQQ